jgi:hypothetical protein
MVENAGPEDLVAPARREPPTTIPHVDASHYLNGTQFLPAYPPDGWHQHHVRARIAAAGIGLFTLMLIGLFVLILLGVSSTFLAVWLTALSSVAAFALAATAYYRTHPETGPPPPKA